MKELIIFFLKNTKIYKKVRSTILKLQNKYEISISPKLLFALQHKNTEFNRYDIIVRILAIEEHLQKNNLGIALYKKMQASREKYLIEKGVKISENDLIKNKKDTLTELIKSFQENGFDTKKAISINPDFKLVDGSHRLACALYFNIEKITVKKNQSIDVPYDLSWFKEHFSLDEMKIIEEKYSKLMASINLHDILIEMLNSENQTFGRGDLYQSLDKFNIPGQRPSNERFKIYQLEKYLKPEYDILDIGSNCGFLSLQMAQSVKSAMGIELGESLVHIAQLAQTFSKIKNVVFKQANFNQFKFDKKFDFICSFAVHFWLGENIQKYAEKLHSLLKPEGMVLFESQNIETYDKDWEEKVEIFKTAGFDEIEKGSLKDDGKINRKFSILKKRQ